MSDLISRQAAIDVVKRLMGDYELSRTVQTGLYILPSAQPEPCEDAVSRAIDADALKLDIVEEGQKSKRYKIGEFWELNRDEIWNVIDRQPTIEARKKGRWLDNYQYGYKCSECGAYLEIDCGDAEMKFCPNCGADMRGEQE